MVPPSEIKQPSAVDFFDVRRWMARSPPTSSEWLQAFVDGQAFTQWLEQRLAPRQTPELEVVFFNESIDAKVRAELTMAAWRTTFALPWLSLLWRYFTMAVLTSPMAVPR